MTYLNTGTFVISSFNNTGTMGLSAALSGSLGDPSSGNGTIVMGNFNLNNNSGASGVTTLKYTGAGETTDRGLLLAQGSAANATNTVDNSGTGTLNIEGGVSSTTTNFSKTLILQGSTSGIGEISGVIADSPTSAAASFNTFASGTTTITVTGVTNAANLYGPGATISGTGIPVGDTISSINGNVITLATATNAASGGSYTIAGSSPTNLTKLGTGEWMLLGANTYSGVTYLDGGTTVISSLNNTGTMGLTPTASSSLGDPTSANSTIVLGNYASGSSTLSVATELSYTGTGETTDRGFLLAQETSASATDTLDNSGTGTLNIEGGVSSTMTTFAKTLVLQGSTSGIGQISGVIADAPTSASASLSFASGTKTITLANASNLYGPGDSISGTGIAAATTITSVSGNTITVNNNTTAVSSGSYSITGSSPTALTKQGTGTWLLSGANTYTGLTTVSAGTLIVGNGTTGSINNTSAIKVTGGSLLFNNGATFNTAATVTSSGTTSVIGYTNSSANNGATVTLGALSLLASSITAIDFGNANINTIIFNQGTAAIGLTGSTVLDVYHYIAGDVLEFSGSSTPNGADNFSKVEFYSGAVGSNTAIGSGMEVIYGGGGAYQVLPTTPEPSTIVVALVFLGLLGLFKLRSESFQFQSKSRQV